MYKGGSFLFTFKINANYPHEPPKVKCEQKVRPPCATLPYMRYDRQSLRSTTQMLTSLEMSA